MYFRKNLVIGSKCRAVIISALKLSHYRIFVLLSLKNTSSWKFRLLNPFFLNQQSTLQLRVKNKVFFFFTRFPKHPLVLKTRVGYSGFNTASFQDQAFLLRFFLHGYWFCVCSPSPGGLQRDRLPDELGEKTRFTPNIVNDESFLDAQLTSNEINGGIITVILKDRYML